MNKNSIKIVGLVCSKRKLGNSEILVKEALNSASKQGASVELMRLTDYDFGSCKGCLQCIFASKQCTIKDDMEFLLSKTNEFNGIIVGAPTYIMFPPGFIKTIIDRSGMVFAKKDSMQYQVGGIISVAGLKGWDYFTIPVLSMFLYSLNSVKMTIADSMSAYAPGPGQILLNKQNIKMAANLGINVYNTAVYNKTGIIKKKANENEDNEMRCPVCTSNFFIIKNNKATCPICLAEGKLNDNKIEWNQNSLNNHRYTNTAIEGFVNEWIRQTKKVYDVKSREIIELRKKYKNKECNIEWIKQG